MAISSETPKIRLAEDDDGTLAFLYHILHRHGYTFETATDGTDALTKAATYQPDCAC